MKDKWLIPPKGTPIKIIHFHGPGFYLHRKVERPNPPNERDCPVAGCWEERLVRHVMES